MNIMKYIAIIMERAVAVESIRRKNTIIMMTMNITTTVIAMMTMTTKTRAAVDVAAAMTMSMVEVWRAGI